MRYYFLSDIHSNIDALEVVADEIKEEGKVIVLGDIVGYGAEPEKVLEWVSSNSDVVIQGNHDYAIGTGDTSWLNMTAAVAAEWTRRRLSPDRLSYLSSLPQKLFLEVEGYRLMIVHGSPDDPLHEYVFPQTHEALFDHYLSSRRVDILAMGHTHYPFEKKTERGLVFNPGSVGQPRDGDPRASFSILTVEGKELRIDNKRVEYDIKSAAEKIYRAGLPKRFGDRLFEGR